MKLKTFLSVAGILAVAFGLAFAAAPARTLTLYGIVATSRFSGSASAP